MQSRRCRLGISATILPRVNGNSSLEARPCRGRRWSSMSWPVSRLGLLSGSLSMFESRDSTGQLPCTCDIYAGRYVPPVRPCGNRGLSRDPPSSCSQRPSSRGWYAWGQKAVNSSSRDHVHKQKHWLHGPMSKGTVANRRRGPPKATPGAQRFRREPSSPQCQSCVGMVYPNW